MLEFVAALIIIVTFTALAFRKNAVAMLSISFALVYFIEIALYYLSPSYAANFFYVMGAKFPPDMGIFTGMYLHSLYPGHIFFNILFFFLAGLPFEQRVGSRRLTTIFLISGITANVIYSAFLFFFGIKSILIGASGAIFGVMGAFIVMYPDDEITFFLGPILMPKIKVKIAVLALLVVEFLATLLWVHDNVAHGAHVVGAVTGAILGLYYLKKGVADSRVGSGKESSLEIDKNTFENLATTDKLMYLYRKICEEDDELIRRAWIEEFFKEKFGSGRIDGKYVIVNGKKYRVYK